MSNIVLTYAFTGHRGDKLTKREKRYGYDIDSDENKHLRNILEEKFVDVISCDIETASQLYDKVSVTIYLGGALGADQVAFEAALRVRNYFVSSGIDFCLCLCIPFLRFNSSWKDKKNLETYHRHALLADDLKIIDEELDCQDVNLKYKYLKRDEYMVDNTNSRVFAVYDGVSQSGGTYYTMTYAKKKNIPVEIISTSYLNKFNKKKTSNSFFK